MSKNAKNLIQQAYDEGAIGSAAMNVLAIPDIGAQIQAGLGMVAEDVLASEVILVTILVDDSGSIRSAGNEDVVRQGYNAFLNEVLLETKKRNNILAYIRYLNGDILCPYRPIDEVPKMDVKNYQATGGTPLYDESVIMLGTVLAKIQEFEDNGVQARSINLIITDGEDLHSRSFKAKDVAAIAKDMLAKENNIIAAMGIDNGHTDFRKVFKGMGIQENWIYTPSDDPKEIGKGFNLFSKSVIRASKSSASFSKTAIGGFGGN